MFEIEMKSPIFRIEVFLLQIERKSLIESHAQRTHSYHAQQQIQQHRQQQLHQQQLFMLMKQFQSEILFVIGIKIQTLSQPNKAKHPSPEASYYHTDTKPTTNKAGSSSSSRSRSCSSSCLRSLSSRKTAKAQVGETKVKAQPAPHRDFLSYLPPSFLQVPQSKS